MHDNSKQEGTKNAYLYDGSIVDPDSKKWQRTLRVEPVNVDPLHGGSSYLEQHQDMEPHSFTEQSSDMETSTGAPDDVSRN